MKNAVVSLLLAFTALGVSFPPGLLIPRILGFASAHAQGIGNPTPGDYFQHNLGELLASGAQMHAGMKEMSAEIEAARVRYFSAATGTGARAKAGAAFAQLLGDKDLMYADLLLSRGLDPGMAGEIELPFIDHGIPEGARTAYIDWIRAVRHSLGAENDQSFLIINAESLEDALKSNLEPYQAYLRLRDRSEFETWNERIGKPELNVEDRPHDLARINVRSLPEAVKASLRSTPQFKDWDTTAKLYADAKGTKYLVTFGRPDGSKREFLFDDKGQSASFEVPRAQSDAASKYGTCQAAAQKLNLNAPYFTWYADKCQFGPALPSSEDVAKWQRDGEELRRLQATQTFTGKHRSDAEFSLKNYRCGLIVGSDKMYKDPLLVPQCISAYQLTDADKKQLEMMVQRLGGDN